MNKVFFNVFSSTPHPSIRKFLNDFVPSLVYPREVNRDSKWTVYPSKDIRPVIITHSYIFDKHPFIDANIKEGEFKVYTTVFDDTVFHNVTGIADIQVILEFEKLDDATNLFKKIREDLKLLCQEETYYEDGFRVFFDAYDKETTNDVPGGIRVQLITKIGSNNLYQLSINLG